MLTLSEIVETFNLTAHPEGGAYLETYRSAAFARLPGFDDYRSLATGIYFLLRAGEFSSLHRIKSDEMWHFYAGGPLEVIELTPAGERRSTILGGGLRRGERLQYVVEAGNWFGARPLAGSAFSFVGCTVAPGFDFRDFELARAADLVRRFPEHEALIRSLTRAP